MPHLVSPRVHACVLLGALVLATFVATGCGGGGGSGSGAAPTSQVGGTAAVGSPIAGGSVTLRCNNDTRYTTTTGSAGAWSRVIPAADLPCVVKLSGGTVGAGSGAPANTQTFYSVTAASGATVTANVTPFTSLALARARGAALDDSWFEGLSDTGRQQLLAGLSGAIAALATALDGYALPDRFNPFDVVFTPAGTDPYDVLLEQFAQALEADATSFDVQMAGFATGGALPPVADAGTPGDDEPDADDLPDTTLAGGVLGVRLATLGTVGGVAQNGAVLDWTGAGGIEVGSTAGVLGESYLVIGSPFSSFGLRNVPNAVGTYDCGDALSATNPRNIELAYAVGQGYSSVGTRSVSGFSCSITVTSVGSVSGSSYAGALEGHFTARLFKTGAPVNLATSVLVSGHFRLDPP